MNADRIVLLMRTELRRRLADRRTWIGAGLFCGVVVLGAWNYWRSLPPRPQDDRLLGSAYFLAVLVAFHVDIARDRRFKFDVILTNNFVSASEIYIAKSAAGIICVAVAALVAFITTLIASLGDVQYSIWYPLLFALVTLLFLPGMILVELVLDMEYPVAIVALLFTTVIAIIGRAGDAVRVLRIMGLDVRRYDYTSLSALVLRLCAAALVLALLYPIFRWRVGPRHQVERV